MRQFRRFVISERVSLDTVRRKPRHDMSYGRVVGILYITFDSRMTLQAELIEVQEIQECVEALLSQFLHLHSASVDFGSWSRDDKLEVLPVLYFSRLQSIQRSTSREMQ
ncbi:hypothetical protein WA026_015064 [Henosepilachna vigintioctopunctata]|uniref:Uncharacterized protein n=1 Tax=Henosepilachna vigintioctopunctata TaxID=420089 RepID=A0AAW1UA81_9CUCU